MVTFQFLVTFQFWWHFSFGKFSVLVMFQSWSDLVWSDLVTIDDLSIFKGLSDVAVSPASRTTKQSYNYANIVPINFCVGLLAAQLRMYRTVSMFLNILNFGPRNHPILSRELRGAEIKNNVQKPNTFSDANNMKSYAVL